MIGKLLVTAVAFAAFAYPVADASAQHAFGAGVPNAKRPEMFGGSQFGRHFDGCRRPDHRNFDRSRGSGCGAFDGGFAYDDSEWALYNNRSWEPDSYNDWWHDRPDRAFPRWVQEQRGRPCSEDRMWWSGTGWHC
jgi:hypothetical protein